MDIHRLREKLEEYGYSKLAALARALVNEKYFEREQSVKAYLSQIFSKKRPVSQKLVEGILALCNNDHEIELILVSLSRKTIREQPSIEHDQYRLFTTYVQKLERIYLSTDNSQQRLQALSDLDKYVSGLEHILSNESTAQK